MSSLRKNLLFTALSCCLLSLPFYADSDPVVLGEVSNAAPSTVTQEDPSSKDTTQETLKKLLEQELKILIDLNFILADLLIQCGNGTIRTTQPEAHVTAMTQVRDVVEQNIAAMQSNVLVADRVYSLEEVATAIRFNSALCKNLEALLDAQFKNPLALPVVRAIVDPASLDIATLQEDSADNSAFFKDVNNAASKAGLVWYNKVYRAVRPYTVAPAIKHSFPIYCAGLMAVVGTFYIYKGIKDNVTQPIMKKLKGVIGSPPQLPSSELPNGFMVIGGDPASAKTVVGKIFEWAKLGLGQVDPVAFTLASASWAAMKSGYTTYRPRMSEKLTQLDNFLLGGVHRKQNTLSAYIPKTSLNDIVGMQMEKDQVRFFIEAILNPEPFARAGANPPATVLFIGGSRAGKTFFAEAIGGEIGRRSGTDAYFLKVRPIHIADFGFEGLIYEAQKSNIRVLFIDEFHRYFKHGTNQDLLNGALTALNQTYDPKNPIIVICATNDPASLPHDLRNRFEHIMRFGKTTIDDRAMYLAQELHKAGIKIDDNALHQLARETQNCSFETLQRLIKTAKRYALSKKNAVSAAHLWRAFDTDIRGIIFDDPKRLSDTTSMVIATNIAAETLIRLIEAPILEEEVTAATTHPYNAAIQEASLSDQYWQTTEGSGDFRHYGHVYSLSIFDTINASSIEQQRARCKVLIAGHVGEALMNGACSYSYRPDAANKAHSIALGIVSRGVTLKDVTPEVRAKYELEAIEYIKELEQEVAALLKEHQDELSMLMIALMQSKLLYRGNIEQLLKPEAIRDFMQKLQEQMQNMPQQADQSAGAGGIQENEIA